MDPGAALSGQFQFSTATVCIAPQASLKAINPLAHSIGLTKNVKVDASPSHVDLTQGIRQDVIATVTNKMAVTVGFEVYEYTLRNLTYGLGLDGSGYATGAAAAVAVGGSVGAAATSVTATGDQTASYPAGSWGFIQDNLDDQVYTFKVASAATSGGNTTITFATGYAIPAGMNFSADARVGPVIKIDSDPAKANKTFAVKLIGTMIKDQRPIIIVFPKVRVTKGFGIAFSDSAFGNMPFELMPMVPLPSDVGYDPDFRQLMHVLSV